MVQQTNRKMEQRYTIEVSKHQLQMLSMMCDRMSRLICGQLDNSVQEFVEQAWERRHKSKDNPHGMGEGWYEMRKDVEDRLAELKKIGWGLERNAYYGIHYDELADLLFEMHQVMRHRLWLDNPNSPWYSVDGDEPMKLTDEPMITVKALN